MEFDTESHNDTRDWNELPLMGDFYETKIERIRNFLSPALTYFAILELLKEQPDNESLKSLRDQETEHVRKNLGYVKAILDTI